MTEEMEKLLLSLTWWYLLDRNMNEKEFWIGAVVKGFGKIEIPESQLIVLEEKHNIKSTRLIGG